MFCFVVFSQKFLLPVTDWAAQWLHAESAKQRAELITQIFTKFEDIVT